MLRDLRMSSIGEKRMTKRSDFAQKLLDDLRIRKEQLSISTDNKGFKGFKETRTKPDFNYQGTKLVTSGSNQIVSYGKVESMEKLDLSKALAFALENAGKATKSDPIISFLQEVGKRSVRSQSSSSSQQLPMVHVHIKEISKGTQRLNQIIKACSNGLSFRKGRYSIQCGEQLMEGAIELEHSLRLLVDIQQASEYTTNKKSKNRIKLIEENQNHQTIKEVAKADNETRLVPLNYQDDKKKRRETSSIEDTSLKPERKGRIPNVVAKLMGLKELPEDEIETKDKNVVEKKTQMKSTTLDLVINKETETGKAKKKHKFVPKEKSKKKEKLPAMQTKLPLRDNKAKILRKRSSHVEVAQKVKEEKKTQDRVMKQSDRKHDQSSNRNDLVGHKKEIKDDSILLIAAERVPYQTPSQKHKHNELIYTDGIDQEAPFCVNSERLSQTVKKGRSCRTEPLSENEVYLKKIVVKSQLFLDTANGLFKLNIPLNFLDDFDVDGRSYYKEDKNLILDCGYELMKRKGRFQELSVHPFIKAPISFSKVNSLDNLVKELSKEFDKLRAYCSKCEDYLPKVLERDVNHKDLTLNSMWDMGWNDLMLAFIEKDDVMRDIEREIFSGLLEEMTRDLICI